MSSSVRVRVWLTLGVLATLHLLLHVSFSMDGGAPDLLTLGLLLASREIGTGKAASLGLFFGLLEDALSVLAFGANSVVMTILGIGGGLTRDLFVGDSRFFLVSYVFIGKWTRDLFHWIAVDARQRQPFVGEVLVDGGIASLYVVAVGVVVTMVTGLGRDT